MEKSDQLILLVEDDIAIASTIIYALEHEHFNVKHCKTGIEAERTWKELLIKAAILDIGLPDQTGFELCRKLKLIHADRPIMFLTAQSDEIDRIVGFELGADDYLCKPFSPRELVLRVKAILRRQNIHEARPTHGRLQHDQQKKQISYQGNKLTLTKSEYLLLSEMLQHPGRVYTRDNLLDILGGTSDQSSDRAIDTHIKELRNKLKCHSDHDFIITHRGLGYSLGDDV